MSSKPSRQSRRESFTTRLSARKPSRSVPARRSSSTDVETGGKSMREKGGGFNELSVAITLLAGISVILFNTINYFNNNIVSTNSSLAIRFLVIWLILELIIVILFILLKGTSLWSLKEGRRDLIEGLAKLAGIMMFMIAVFILICTCLIFAFCMITNDLELPSTTVYYLGGILIVSTVVTFYLGGVFGYLKNIVEWIFLKIKQKFLKTDHKNRSGSDKHLLSLVSVYFAISIIIIFIWIVLVACTDYLSPATTLLLCGSYSTEVTHFPDANTDIMSITIKDTGIPSMACYIELCRVNKSNENIFQRIDNITLQESEKKSSEYMVGKKENGIYYLFIDTSDLPSDNYFLHAEVTLSETEDSDLFLSKKYGDTLFYLPPKNKTGNIFNQTPIL